MRIEREASLMMGALLAQATELDERECGPEAEALRAQAGAMMYEQPELFFHQKMDAPRSKPRRISLWERLKRLVTAPRVGT